MDQNFLVFSSQVNFYKAFSTRKKMVAYIFKEGQKARHVGVRFQWTASMHLSPYPYLFAELDFDYISNE